MPLELLNFRGLLAQVWACVCGWCLFKARHKNNTAQRQTHKPLGIKTKSTPMYAHVQLDMHKHANIYIIEREREGGGVHLHTQTSRIPFSVPCLVLAHGGGIGSA